MSTRPNSDPHDSTASIQPPRLNDETPHWAVIHTLSGLAAHIATHGDGAQPVSVLTAKLARDACTHLGLPATYAAWTRDATRAAIAATAEQIPPDAHPALAAAAVLRLDSASADLQLQIITHATTRAQSAVPSVAAAADGYVLVPVRNPWLQAAATAFLLDSIL